MRLFEIVCPKLYLRSKSELEVGATIPLNGGCARLGSGIEDMLEAKRPVGKLSRQSSYPLYTNPEKEEFVYRVDALYYDRLHTGWLKLICELDTLQCEALDLYAARYWSGDECTEAAGEPWQYLADSVKIIRRHGGSI